MLYVTTLNSSGEGVVTEVTHGPSFLMFDIGVASERGPTNPMEERGIRSWGAGEGVPGPGCKILRVRHNLINTNGHIPCQLFQVFQLHISIRVLSNPQTLNISVITDPLQIMDSSSPDGMLNTKIHAGSVGGPLRELLEKAESARF